MARKGSHLPLPSNDLGLPGWMGRIISLISIHFQSSLHHVKSSHLGTSQHPRGPLPGRRKSCTQQLRAGPALQPGPSVETRTASASAPRAPRRPARLPGNPARHARGLGPGPGSARAAGPHCWSGSGQGQPPHRGMRAQEGPPEAVVPREGHKSPRRAWSQGELRTPAAADGEAPRMPVSTRVP